MTDFLWQILVSIALVHWVIYVFRILPKIRQYRTIYLSDLWDHTPNDDENTLKDLNTKLGKSIRYAEYSFSLGFTFTFMGVGMTAYTVFENIYLAIGVYVVGWGIMQTYSRRIYGSHMLKNKKKTKKAFKRVRVFKEC